jgi:hypothetical protein
MSGASDAVALEPASEPAPAAASAAEMLGAAAGVGTIPPIIGADIMVEGGIAPKVVDP